MAELLRRYFIQNSISLTISLKIEMLPYLTLQMKSLFLKVTKSHFAKIELSLGLHKIMFLQ